MSAARVLILGLEGKSNAIFITSVTSAMKSLHEPAAALEDVPVTLEIFDFTLFKPSLFLVNVSAFFFNLSTSCEHAVKDETAASSNFLHLEKAPVQFFSPLEMSPSSLILQFLTASLRVVISVLVQQVQASAAVSSLLRPKHF